MAFTGHEEHEITFKEGADLTRNYRATMTTKSLKGGYFSKDAIQALLDQPECIGIRYYYGLDDRGIQVMVLVGVNALENDLIGDNYLCMEMSTPCPNQCGQDNILNS